MYLHNLHCNLNVFREVRIVILFISCLKRRGIVTEIFQGVLGPSHNCQSITSIKPGPILSSSDMVIHIVTAWTLSSEEWCLLGCYAVWLL
jgi:hypothetical protein